jgi:hypothetical protein
VTFVRQDDGGVIIEAPISVSELLGLATRERLTVETVYAMHADPGPWIRVVNAVR